MARKIHSFSKFNDLYEAETASEELRVGETESSKLYDQTLSLILTSILNSYLSGSTFPIESYEGEKADLTTIKSTPITEKPAAFIAAMEKVKEASKSNTIEGAKEAVDAWLAAGSKATEALTSIINQYKDQPEELKHINNFANAKLDSTLLKEGDKPEFTNEDDDLSEGFFQGKKGRIDGVQEKVGTVNAKLKSLAQTPGMSAEVQKLQNEVTQISAKMKELKGKSNKEINKAEIENASDELDKILKNADEYAEKMLKQDSTNKEAASILIQAFTLVQDATIKEENYIQKKEEALQKERSGKISVSITSDGIEYDPDKEGVVNADVKKFQDLVADKFGSVDQIASLPQFKRMGADAKFGKGTRDMVVILKRGYGLPDRSKDITKELMDEIQTQPIQESASRILCFSGYVNLFEAFKISTAVETAKALPSYSAPAKSAPAKSAPAPAIKKETAQAKSGDTVKKVETSGQKLSNLEIQKVAQKLISASNRPGTDDEKFLSAVKELQSKKDFEILDALIQKSYDLRGKGTAERRKIGLLTSSVYKNFQDMVNGEFSGEFSGFGDVMGNTNIVDSVARRLRTIGVKVQFQRNAKSKKFVKDSFVIK